MNSRLIKTVLSAACALAPLAAVPAGPVAAQAVSEPAQSIDLSIGRGQLITVPGTMTDIFVANESVADVQVKSQRQLYVFGKAGGETTIYASNGAGDIVWSANVRVGSNIDTIDQMMALAMPDARIAVATISANTVLLTGTVAAPEDAAEAERLAKAFLGEGANVITRLKMATPLQVNLRVRFAEVSRSLVRAIGVNLTSVDSTDGFRFGIGQGRTGALPNFTPGGNGNSGLSNIARGTTLGAFGRFLGLDIGAALDLAETQGLVSTLSQPNLTALSGETAEFLAGGEYPIPSSQGLGATSIEYKRYGVSLSYTPTVLTNGRISIRVRPEVSELSSQGAVTLNGFQIPALTVRRAETTVELGSGQSFMIAGLLSANANNTIDKAPGAGDIPILGNLFRSTEFRRGETELVIIVTPYLVNPVSDSEIKLPTDGLQAPTAVDQFLLNKETDGVTGGTRPMPRPADQAPAAPTIGAVEALPGRPSGEQRAEGPSTLPGFSLR